jgi:hypothetical protein
VPIIAIFIETLLQTLWRSAAGKVRSGPRRVTATFAGAIASVK